MGSDVNDWTLDECRDWLAEREHGRHGEGLWYRLDDEQGVAMPHPYPATLDAAAKALPSGFDVNIESMTGIWIASHITHGHFGHVVERGVTAPSELLARFRLACAARMATKGPNDER